jgi:hypothetical protein
VAGVLACTLGCAPPAEAPGRGATIDTVASDLLAMSGPEVRAHADTWRGVLEGAIAKDAYTCLPSPDEVFSGDAPEGVRKIRGAMPHYGLFFGPMSYTIERRRDGEGARYRVSAAIAVDPPPAYATLELPDCAPRGELEGDVTCEGAPYSSSPGTDACPKAGRFRAPATPRNVEALLARWSREAERYYDRDAAAYGVPVSYDFTFAIASGQPADLTVPLAPTCGRTPYFAAMRAGWSLPIVAHEVGHVLGLLDEYEALSGITALYPKTPFAGAEVSRMGLSMREGTRVLPLHHYLVLRRYLCAEPASLDPFDAALR